MFTFDFPNGYCYNRYCAEVESKEDEHFECGVGINDLFNPSRDTFRSNLNRLITKILLLFTSLDKLKYNIESVIGEDWSTLLCVNLWIEVIVSIKTNSKISLTQKVPMFAALLMAIMNLYVHNDFRKELEELEEKETKPVGLDEFELLKLEHSITVYLPCEREKTSKNAYYRCEIESKEV